jgi:hypothetical protein
MRRFGPILSACIFVAACGGEATSPQPAETSELVSAATGASLTLEGKLTSVNIPANSLAEDTTISIATSSFSDLPELASARDEVLTIQPEGLTLELAATVVLGLGAPVQEGESFKVMLLNDGVWQRLEGATLMSGGLVSAKTTTLGTLALVVEKQTPPAPGQIRGTLGWSNGSPIANFPILLYQGETKLTETKTDEEGKFSFVDVSAGSYTLMTGEGAECPVKAEVEVTSEASPDVELVMCGS